MKIIGPVRRQVEALGVDLGSSNLRTLHTQPNLDVHSDGVIVQVLGTLSSILMASFLNSMHYRFLMKIYALQVYLLCWEWERKSSAMLDS